MWTCRPLQHAIELIGSIVLLPISGSIRRAAGELLPTSLRSLDAIHLSTALEIKADLHSFLTYDSQLAKAAEEFGFESLSPGSV